MHRFTKDDFCYLILGIILVIIFNSCLHITANNVYDQRVNQSLEKKDCKCP